MTVRELVNVIGFKVDEAQMKHAEDTFTKFQKKIIQIFSALAVIEFTKSIIEAAAAEEKLNAEFSTLIQSTEKATKLLDDLETMASKGIVLIDKDNMAEASRQLIKFGMSAEQIPATLSMLGNIAGTSKEKLISLSTGFARVQSEGILSYRTLMQIRGQGGFDILGEMARTSGRSVPELQAMMKKGQISANMVYDAFKTATSEGGKFFGMTQKLTQTFEGQLIILKANLDKFLEYFGTPLLTLATKIMSALTSIISNPTLIALITEIMKRIGDVLDTALGYFQQLLPLLEPILSKIFVIFDKVFLSVQKLMPVLFKLISALLPVITPILDLLLGLLDPILEIVTMAIDLIVSVLTPLIETLTPILNMVVVSLIPVFKILSVLISIIGNALKSWLWPITIILNMLKVVLDFFNLIYTQIFSKFSNVFSPIQNFMKTMNALMDKLRSIITGGLVQALQILFQVLGKFLEPVLQKISDMLTKLGEFLNNITKDLLTNVINAVNWLLEILNKIIDTVNRVIPGGGKLKKIEPINIKDILNTVVQGNKTINNNNIKLEASFNFKDSGMSPATQQTVASAFQFQLKRVLLATTT